MKVLSFGSLNIDYCYQMDHIILPGETLSSSGLSVSCGGKGLNQSIALRKAGAEVWHAGIIGGDGGILKQAMEDAGVVTTLLKIEESQKSGHTIIQIESGTAQNSIIVHAGTNGMVDEAYADFVAAQFAPGDIAVFQNEISSLAYAMKRCKEQGMRIVFNPSPMTRELAASDIYQYVDDIFINEIEGKQMTGETDPEKILREMARKWPGCRTILTLGEDGAAILKDGAVYRQKAYPCTPVDTTGAGDTFSGYFIALTAAGRDAEEALDLASRAASLAVQKQGAAAAIPYLEDVLASR